MPDGGIMADQFIDPARIYIRNIAKRGFDVSAVRAKIDPQPIGFCFLSVIGKSAAERAAAARLDTLRD
jgi:hypothetical protein